MKRALSSFVLIVTIAGMGSLKAQSIALEYGFAGVENIGTEPNVNFSLLLPFTEQINGSFTYSKWQGEDSNLEQDFNSEAISSEDLYYGNSALNFMVFVNAFQRQASSIHLGAGLGMYEFVELDRFNNRRVRYESSLTMGSIFKLQLSKQSSAIIKGLIGSEEFGDPPHWRLLTFGLEVRLF